MSARLFSLLMHAAVSLTAQQPLRPAGDIASYSLEKEAALGRQLAAEFQQRTAPVESPLVQNYITRLGQNLLAYIPDARFAFTFTVIAGDPCPASHEPVALPGGYLFVPASLIMAAQDVAELAGMLSHSIHHVTERHGVRRKTTNEAGIPLIFMGGWAGRCPDGLAVPRAFLAQQWSNEMEADVLAVQTMARAGFDPLALVRYLERAHASRLPDREQRLAAMRSAVQTLPERNYAPAGGEEFVAVQEELRSLRGEPLPAKAPPSLRRRRP
jgi:predicted Zn-dependent protease